MCIQIVFPILHEITPAVSNTCLLLRIKVQADSAGCGQWSRTPQELHSGVHRGWVGGRPQGFSQDLHRVSEWQPAPGGNRHLQQGQVGTHALFTLSLPAPSSRFLFPFCLLAVESATLTVMIPGTDGSVCQLCAHVHVCVFLFCCVFVFFESGVCVWFLEAKMHTARSQGLNSC